MSKLRSLETQQDKEICKKELRERVAKLRENQGPEEKEISQIKIRNG